MKIGRRIAYPGLIPAHAGKTCNLGIASQSTWAHPRSRGENSAPSAGRTVRAGSSPLTRGKLAKETGVPADLRLIPAHAGKTGFGGCGEHAVWAHPRSRGENYRWRPTGPTACGSSPLTRGKLRPGIRSRLVHGLIPAHAGKTCPGRRAPDRRTAHPRSRGENTSALPSSTRRMGSSPLTRGKPLAPLTSSVMLRLIPAHAGKTVRSAAVLVLIRAHPRSRGENRCVVHD